MKLIAPFLCGIIAAIIANLIGPEVWSLSWFAICAPWWFLGLFINEVIFK